jgi:transcription initiation factor TFIIB
MVQKLISHTGEILSCDDSITITDSERGEMICQKCGRVLKEKIIDKRKTRSFSYDEGHPKTGDRISLTVHDMGLSTIIGKSNHDFVGRKLSFEMRQSVNRMRLWDSRSQTRSSSDMNLRIALFEMYKLKDKLGLSDAVIERSAYIYRKATKANLVRGRSIRSMVGACLYVACRDMDAPRTIADISQQTQVKPKSVAKSYRVLFQNLKLTVPVPDTTHSIIKIANNLRISETTKREAMKIYDLLREKELTAGKNPCAVASAVIYMAGIISHENITQRAISKVSGITSVTLRNRMRDYEKHVSLFHPN